MASPSQPTTSKGVAEKVSIRRCLRYLLTNGCRLDQDLNRRRMSEKAMWAGAGAIGAGLEDHNQVARMGERQLHPIGE